MFPVLRVEYLIWSLESLLIEYKVFGGYSILIFIWSFDIPTIFFPVFFFSSSCIISCLILVTCLVVFSITVIVLLLVLYLVLM